MKGNEKVIDYLNTALRMELTAINQYWLHYRLLDDWGFTKMSAKWREESMEEMEHADKLVTRILFLEGHPNMQQLDPILIGQSIGEILEADLKGELEACTFYAEGRRVCQEAGDYVSMKLFDMLLNDEEGHVDYLETQLNLFKAMGEQNYAQLQAEDANASEGEED